MRIIKLFKNHVLALVCAVALIVMSLPFHARSTI